MALMTRRPWLNRISASRSARERKSRLNRQMLYLRVATPVTFSLC
jgi:hypothetical protein